MTVLYPLTLCFSCMLNQRLQHEAELKRLEEETARRIEEAVRKNVEERMNTEEAKAEIERRTKEAYEKMLLDVEIQLKNEKESALNEARRKEVSLIALLFNVFWVLNLVAAY